MTLPATNSAISLSQVNTELSLTSTATIDLDYAAVRSLFGVASGTISLSNGWGKSNAPPPPVGGVWTNRGILPYATRYAAGVGASSAAKLIGGAVSPTSVETVNTYNFNGLTWTASTSMITARSNHGATGSQSAALASGGVKNNLLIANTEQLNNVTWTSKAAMPVICIYNSLIGTSSNALNVGGNGGAANDNLMAIGATSYNSIKFNGTSWVVTSALIYGASAIATCGTPTAALGVGGMSWPWGITINISQTFNGTTWASGIAYPTTIGVGAANASGTVSSAIVFGGGSASWSGGVQSLDSTYIFNGTTWTAGAMMNTARKYAAGTGSSSSSAWVGTGSSPTSGVYDLQSSETYA